MTVRDVQVVPYRPHGSAHPNWLIYGRGLPGLADDPKREGAVQIATCHDETTARVIAAALQRMSTEYLESLLPDDKEMF